MPYAGEERGRVHPQGFTSTLPPSLEGQGLWWDSLLHRHLCMFSTVLHPLGHKGAWQGLKEGDRQGWGSLKIRFKIYKM